MWWVLVPVLGVLWAWRRLRDTWFFYDEWSLVQRTVSMSPWSAFRTGFNGHLWLLADPVYRLQVHAGLDGRVLVVAVFVVALVTLHLALAWVLVRGDVPVPVALLGAGMLVYMGRASQNFMFAIQFSPALATAAGLAGAAVVVGAAPTRRRVAAAAGLPVVCVLVDSGVGAIMLAFGIVAVVCSWPRRSWWVVLPGVATLGLWAWRGDLGPDFPASLWDRCRFAVRLLVRSAGAVLGGGVTMGVVVLLALAGQIAWLLWRRRFDGPVRALALAGIAAAAVAVAGITQSRAGLLGFNFVDFNRYLQNVGMPLGVALLVVTWRVVSTGWVSVESRRIATVAMAGVCVLGFLAGVPTERAYGPVFVGWNRSVEEGVADAVAVIDLGCPPGRVLDPSSVPLGAVSPQVTTQLLLDLRVRGHLDPQIDRVPSPALVDAMCVDD
ncbi:MAG: hypothetical protein RL238_1477 [Actinomycetota bacterium]